MLNKFINKYKEIIFFFFCYSASYLFLLVNNGIFWDDWLTFTLDNAHRFKAAIDIGTGPLAFFEIFFLNLPHTYLLVRIVTFSSYFLAGLCIYGVLKNIKQIDDFSRVIIVTLFLVYSINAARIAFCVTHYAFSYFLFFCGFFLIAKYLVNRNLFIRVLALVLIFLSFFTNSFLVFYLIVLLYLLYKEKNNFTSLKILLISCLKYADFIFLPIFFWLSKDIFFIPRGYFKGHYNQLKVQFLFDLPQTFLVSFKTSFLQIIRRSIFLGLENIWLVIIIAIIIFLFLRFIKPHEQEMSKKSYLIGFLLGFFCFTLALIPYLLVGAISLNQDWLSRHQFLTPLGAGLMIFYLVQLFFAFIKLNNIKTAVFSLIISLFIVSNLCTYMEYYKDWLKQLAIIQNFKPNAQIKSGKYFVFIDKAPNLNAKCREIRLYEYTGLLKYAFPKEEKIGFSKFDLKNIDSLDRFCEYYYGRYLNRKNILNPDVIIVIKNGELKMTRIKLLDFMILNFFNKEKFNKEIKGFIRIETNK